VIHVNQDVAALRQFDDGVAGTAVAGVANRALAGVDAEGEALEVGLDMLRAAGAADCASASAFGSPAAGVDASMAMNSRRSTAPSLPCSVRL
jgi:hypothetical protein